MNIVTTKPPGQFAGSHGSVGSHETNNQFGVTLRHNVGSYQGSKGVATYPLLSAGLGGSQKDFGIMSNTLGMGVNVSTGPSVMDRTSSGAQVRLSPLPSVPCSDRPCELRQCPGPNPYPVVPLSTIPEQGTTPTVRLKRPPLQGSTDLRPLPKGLMAVR